MLTMKTRYALMALVRLGREYGKGPVLISEISDRERIPKRFLENILQELRTSGVVDSRLGRKGGYYLALPPEKISLHAIIRQTEGSVGLIDCVSETKPKDCLFCKQSEECRLHHIFADIRDFTLNKLSQTSLSDIL